MIELDEVTLIWQESGNKGVEDAESYSVGEEKVVGESLHIKWKLKKIEGELIDDTEDMTPGLLIFFEEQPTPEKMEQLEDDLADYLSAQRVNGKILDDVTGNTTTFEADRKNLA